METEQLQEKLASVEQQTDADRDRDGELAARSEKLQRKIDRYRQELSDTKQHSATLKSQLEQMRHDKVVSP